MSPRFTVWRCCAAWMLVACGADATSDASSDATSEAVTSTSSTASSSTGDVAPGSSSGAADVSTSGGGTTTTTGDGPVATTSGGTTGDVSSSSDTGPLPDGCMGIETIELLDAFVSPLQGESWAPGTDVEVGVTLYNGGPDFTSYPSIVVESDHPQVTSPNPDNQTFAVLSGMSTQLSAVFTADAAVASGTEVTFTIRMATLETPCPNGDVVMVSGTVG